MAKNSDNSGGFGCLAVIVIAVIIALWAWITKVFLIGLGGGLAIGSVYFTVSYLLERRKTFAQRANVFATQDDFRDAVANLSASSATHLRDEINRWDEIQVTRGVGTRLESMYYSNEIPEYLRETMLEVNDLIERGEYLRAEYEKELARPRHEQMQTKVRRLDSMDKIWVQLEDIRRSVTSN